MGFLNKMFEKGKSNQGDTATSKQSQREIKALIKALADDDASKKARESLIDIGGPAVEPLIAPLTYKNKDILWWAARTLGSIGDERAVEPLIKLYEKPPNERIRTAAALSLGKFRDPHAIPTLVDELQYANFLEEVKRMLIAYGPIAVEPIIAGMEKNGTISESIRVLGLIGDARAENILRKYASSNENPSIRNLALEALSKLGLKIEISQDEIEKLKVSLLSNRYSVRKAALEQARSMAASINDEEFQHAFQASEKLELAFAIQNQAAYNTKPMQACHDAIKLQPQFAAAYVCLAYLHRLYTTDKPSALKWVKKAIKLDPQNMTAWIELGNVHVDLGDVPKAASAFHHVVSTRIAQKNLEPHLRLVTVYQKLGMLPELNRVLLYLRSGGGVP